MNNSIIKMLAKMIYISSFIFMLSSNSFFQIWICFELNLIMFIFLMNKMNINLTNAILKYFIIQSMSSSLILLFFTLKEYYSYGYIFIKMALWMKMGMFPFSSWFFQVSQTLNWMTWFLLNTLQKFMPLWILSMFYMKSNSLYLMMMVNSIYSTLEIWNQTSLRWFINSSSLNHFSWMILSIPNNPQNNWLFYFLVYSLISYNLMYLINKLNYTSFYNLMNMNTKISKQFNFIMFNFLGMPPFLGFLPKLLILMNITNTMITIIMIINTILISIMYLYYFMPNLKKSLNYKLKQANFTNFYFNFLMKYSLFLIILIF